MKHLRLTLVATACALALAACSSGGSSSSATQQMDKLEQKAKQEEQRLAEQAKKAQEEAEKKQAELRLKEQQRLAAEKVAKEKAEIARVDTNKAEVKKGFVSQGSESKTFEKEEIDYTTFETKVVKKTKEFSYVSGTQVAVENNVLTNQALQAKQTDLNQLIVDGKTIELYSNAEINERGSVGSQSYDSKALAVDGYTGKVSSLPKGRYDDNFSQVRYGYVTDKDGKTTLFVQGHLTPETERVASFYYPGYHGTARAQEGYDMYEMPKSGVWEYTAGSAFYGKNGVYKEFGANAVADMDNKKVKVNITENGADKLTLGGVISGNTFEGSYNGIDSKGAFYGSDARDVAGVFYNSNAGSEKDYNGVFGATRSGYRATGEADALKNFDVK
ncbi:hypothetical protein BMT54_08110 [Pasteurellaceae bacterium 15-036681]|nr:hypothetical protein BMT54_08110 [Pasteurellaceae bacterium 15-036681]